MADISGDFQILPQQRDQKLSFTAVPKSKSVLYAGLVMGFFLLVYGAFYFFNDRLDKQLATLDGQLTEIQNNRNTQKEGRLLQIGRQLTVFNELIRMHSYWSEGLNGFFRLIKPQVRFESLEMNGEKGTLNIKATTDSYESVAQQLSIFYKNNDIQDVSFGGMSSDESGKINFVFVVTLDLNKFIYK